MNVTRNNISATKIELTVEVSADEMKNFSQRAATKISENTKIEGFRPGKAPYDVVLARVGEMAILEEASRIAVSKTIDQALIKEVTEEWIGQPEITITKIAPENPFEYRALITLLPSVELGAYKDFNVSLETAEATEEEVGKMIEQLRDMRATEAIADRPSQTGDKLVVDVNLFVDKVPMEGGQAKETAVILGKDYFVPGFDEHVTGMKIGDSREFFLTYPADHHQSNLAGKKVEFKVDAKQVYAREMPELNDEFAMPFGLKTLEELKTNIKKSIADEKKGEAETKLERMIIEKIIEGSTIGEIPEKLIEDETNSMMHEISHNVARSGGTFENYLQSLGKSAAQFAEELKPQAIERMKATLALRKIVALEKITVDEGRVEEELGLLKKRYANDVKAVESLSSPAYRRHLQGMLLNRAVIAKLKEWNIKKEV